MAVEGLGLAPGTGDSEGDRLLGFKLHSVLECEPLPLSTEHLVVKDTGSFQEAPVLQPSVALLWKG